MSDKAKLILRGGVIHTMAPEQPVVQAIAIGADGFILACGSDAALEGLAGPGTRVRDLGGRFVMPGIVDFHLHALSSMAVKLHSVALGSTLSFDEVLDRIRVGAQKPGPREWVIASAFGAPALAEMEARGAEARSRLDAVSHGRPVLLEHLSGHGGFANSLALERAGVGAPTANPADGEIVRAPSGEPTGLLRETAAWLVERAVPKFDRAALLDVGRAMVALFNGVGMTGFCDASTSLETLEVFQALDAAGDLSCWAGFTLALSPTCQGYDAGKASQMLAERRSLCGPHMIAEAAKIFLDGVPSLRTAAMLQPYARGEPGAPPHDGGPMSRSLEELVEEIATFDREGLSVKVHAIGDRAVRTMLNAVEAVRARNGAGGPQHHLAHGQFITRTDIPRLAALNVIADLNPPLWFPSAASNAHQALVGPERYAGTWPIRSLLAAGADAAAGSDWLTVFPDIEPWRALAGMVTRKDASGTFPGSHSPEEAIELDAALPLFTRNPARAMRLGDRTGMLMPGLSADLIVLDRNLHAIAPEEIAGTQIVATLFEGRLVHGEI
ncbi:amidohydrolase [Labrys neptuniae]